MVLENAGYEFMGAMNAENGMMLIEEGNPDLVILDVMMEQPDDGFVVAQDLRHKGVKTPIIILSSIGHVTGYKFAKDSEVAPVDEFVSKPIAPKDLVAKVKKFLRK